MPSTCICARPDSDKAAESPSISPPAGARCVGDANTKRPREMVIACACLPRGCVSMADTEQWPGYSNTPPAICITLSIIRATSALARR
jgi:hypothetical protein